MAVPKRKMSKSRMRSRKKSYRTIVPATGACSQCGAPKELHRVCPSCGYYAGRQVISTKTD